MDHVRTFAHHRNYTFFSIVDAAKNGGQHAAKNGSGGSKAAAADAVTRKTGMSVDEAMNILNITKEADLAKIVKVLVRSIITGQSLLILTVVVRHHEYSTSSIIIVNIELPTLAQSERQDCRWIILPAVQGCPCQGALGDGVGCRGESRKD